MLKHPTNDARLLALNALAETLADERRARRFLDLTGLEADSLRAALVGGDDSPLAALLAFLSAHEPDLIAVAAAIGAAPGDLVAAGEALA